MESVVLERMRELLPEAHRALVESCRVFLLPGRTVFDLLVGDAVAQSKLSDLLKADWAIADAILHLNLPDTFLIYLNGVPQKECQATQICRIQRLKMAALQRQILTQ